VAFQSFNTFESNTLGMKEEKNLYRDALQQAFLHSNDFLGHLDSEPVDVQLSYQQMRALWDWNLPVQGKPAPAVIEELNTCARPGLVHNQSGRFFSFVIGGAHPSAIAADWLTSSWDQNAGLYIASPASAIVEEIAGSWLKQIFHIPEFSSFAFVTGCQMASFTCLLAARNHVFNEAGWNIEKDGFYGAPKVRIIVGEFKHSTIVKALRMLGFGDSHAIQIPVDKEGRINPELVAAEFKRDPDIPTMLILQAGEINTGAFDDFASLIPLAHQYNAWVHIDGAFGLWAKASSKYQHLVRGSEAADSWASDGHKWLNLPYDSGYAFVAHADAHFMAINQGADYLLQDDKARDQMKWTPELSRRARGFTTFAAIKELGTIGIEDLVNRCCRYCAAIIDGVSQHPLAEVLAYPIINQGLVRFCHPLQGDIPMRSGEFTEQVIKLVNASGEAFFQPTTFRGQRCMRVSVSGWRTNDRDVERTVQAVLEAIDTAERAARQNG
jgi:glutamate/tyrosine decarboxylase-like PLP-dependent enzyme